MTHDEDANSKATEPKPGGRHRRELGGHVSEFLLSAGLLAGHADGNFSAEEREYLIGALRALIDSPAEEIDQLAKTADEAKAMFAESMAWLSENAGDARLVLFEHLARLVATDGVMTDEERDFLRSVTEGLGIPMDKADAIVQEILFKS